MSPFKIKVFYFIIFNIIAVVQSLIELPTAEHNNIAATESIIRSTVNNLFSSLRLTDVKGKPRLKQFSTIHNFFVSLTLRDHDNLNEIVRLTREKRVDNTSIVTKPLNELLNEDNNDEENEATVTLHVETFLNKLRDLKGKHNVNYLSEDTIINGDILKMLVNKYESNFTENEVAADDDDNVLDEFWRDSARRIYKGTDTKSKHFPFMASVQFFNKFQCAGSIIKSDLIITAASCLQLAYNNRFFRENPAFLTVTVGSRFYEGGGENIPILEIYFHPTYDPKNLMNNLALMRMIRHLNFKKSYKKVKKIDIDRIGLPLPENTDGITIVGWGAKESTNILSDPWYNRLSFAVLDFYPLRECREVYTKEYVTRTNFCAGFLSKGGGACNRDVGGPGIVNGLLTGVVSFGSPVCGAPDAPTVFTKLGYYADWIEEIMDQSDLYGLPSDTKRSTTPKQEPLLPTFPPGRGKRTTFYTYPIEDKRWHTVEDPAAALRMLEDPKFFTNFLATMFSSKEINEYNELIDSPRHNAKDKTIESLEEAVTGVTTTKKALPVPVQLEQATELVDADISQETSTMEHNKYTLLDTMYTVTEKDLTSSVEMEIDNDVEQNFDGMHETKEINEPKDIAPEKKRNLGTPQKLNDLLKDVKPFRNENKRIKLLSEPKEISETDIPKDITARETERDSEKNKKPGSNKNQDDSVLTLLYLTDSENKKGDEKADGQLSIPNDSFNDVTFRQNTTDSEIIDFISEKDLLHLLSEAIDIEMKANDNKDAAAS